MRTAVPDARTSPRPGPPPHKPRRHATRPSTPRSPPCPWRGSLWSVEFSPDGKTLAAGGHTGNGTIHLWNVTDPDRPTAIGRPLTVETGFVAVLAFSPDSRTLVATPDDGVATLWDLDAESSTNRICAASSGAPGEEEGKRYVDVPHYDPPCRKSSEAKKS
ncbi:WD40 repeat domain-containing protein [Streptomyces parvus]|uniref:WD40 repeat domain-containing protein n=1 Tax=Streptomyces parvus TaxID=66428 RepID=UPI0034029694